MVVGILITAVHTTITVVVYGAIAHIQLIHHIHHTHDDLGIMSGIAIDLDIEDMAATRQLMIRRLNLSLMAG